MGRSQIAEAFFNKLSKKHHATSAGISVGEKHGKLLYDQGTGSGKFILESMSEVGYDLSKNKRKQLTPEMVKKFDKIVVIMAEKKLLPDYVKKSPKTIYWDVEDGKDQPYDFHVKMRDQIKNLVEKFVRELG